MEITIKLREDLDNLLLSGLKNGLPEVRELVKEGIVYYDFEIVGPSFKLTEIGKQYVEMLKNVKNL